MPKVHTQVKSTRGNAVKCGRCGTPIVAGQKYKKYSKRHGFGRISGTTYYRCMKSECAPKPSELASGRTAEMLALGESVESAVEAFRNNYDVDALVSEIDSVISDAESLKDEMQSGRDNMPEHLQDGETGQLIEQRVEALETFIDELTSAKDNVDGEQFEDEPEPPALIDFDSESEYETAQSNYETEREEWETARDEKVEEIAGEFDGIELET